MKKVLSRGSNLYSDDVFWVLFDYEVTRSQRYPSALTLLQIEMTPGNGNPAVLRAASSIFNSTLNSHLRSVDIPTGNEKNYLIVLPTTDDIGGRTVCERMLSIYHNKIDTHEGNSISFSVNIGMASHAGGQSLTMDGLLKQAENALNQSKLKGPNTYIVNSDL